MLHFGNVVRTVFSIGRIQPRLSVLPVPHDEVTTTLDKASVEVEVLFVQLPADNVDSRPSTQEALRHA